MLPMSAMQMIKNSRGQSKNRQKRCIGFNTVEDKTKWQITLTKALSPEFQSNMEDDENL